MTKAKPITTQRAAAYLDGRQYREEGTRGFFAELRAAGLVAVFGASDDIMIFDGAIHDEFYDKTCVTACGRTGDAGIWCVEPLWCAEPGISWTYKTNIPHETFEIWEDDEIYCRGLVFALADLAEPESAP